jgi:myo-inositol 2-dehydrogenase/D-chiro-inositol 1-dehydrogenase
VDTDRAAAERLAKQTGAASSDAEHAFADTSLQAVVIASSTDTHLPLIEAAARAGLAVFCEKPLDLDIANALRSTELARAAGIGLYIGFNRRFDPSFRRLKDEIANGAIGAVEVLSITSRDPAPPPADYVRRSGGLFRDMMIHDFDLARWLLDEEPETVFAEGSCLFDPSIADAGDVDTAVVVLRTGGGTFCQITNSRHCSYGYDQRIEAFGAGGLVREDNRTATRVEHAGPAGFLREPALPFFLERYREAYALEMQEFIRALQGKAHSLASGADGVRALELADAAERSRRTHRAVPLPG